jgi:hypothetical protein
MAENDVFRRLKKLFSTNTVVRNIGGKKLRVADTDNIQSFVNRRAIDRYHRVYSSMTGGYGSSHGRHEMASAFQGSRLQLFRDYDMMDNDPIISSVMDIYADESTVKDEFGQILSVKSGNEQIQDILNNLFYDVLNVEFNLWPWVRNMCKYGDLFLYLQIDEQYGVVNAVPMSIYETIRIEGEDPKNPFSVKFKIENDFLQLGKKEFDNYEIAHFRLLSDTNFLPYGKSMVEGGRRVWKQLQLMEDAMLIHRIMRAPDKRKILVDIGNIPPAEVDTYMQRIIDRMKKTPLVDPKTGDYNLRYNMMNITEDFYLPVRGRQSGTDITNLTGLQFNAIDDIEYLRNKLMAAFKVPRSFLGYEEDNTGKASLAAQDVRFARTIERIQRIVVSELTKIAIIHLYVQGFRNEELVNFEIEMTSPSVVYEQEKINLWTQKIALANNILLSKFMSREWIYHNILEISTEDAKQEYERMLDDAKYMGELALAEQQAAMPMPPAGEEGAPPPPDGAPAQEPPPEGDPNAPAGGEQGAEAQVNDVDQLLANFQAPEEESELDEAKLGRPREPVKYGTDRHPRGRDPLGHRLNANVLKGTLRPLRKQPNKSPFSRKQTKVKKLVKELSGMTFPPPVPTLLSEDNIIDTDTA